MRKFTTIFASLWLVLLGFGAASAHGTMRRAVPLPGSVVKTAPTQVSVWFSEPLEPSFSRVEVLDAAGKRVDKDDSRVSPDDPKRLSVGLAPLAPGAYRVLWRVLSVDTHSTSGEYRFILSP